MLTLYHNGAQYPLQDTEYYIRELSNGMDECIFTIPIHDPIYTLLSEEENITDRAGQTYKVKQIDGGASNAKVVCQLDIDAWKQTLTPNFDSGSKTVAQQINAVCPAGWSVIDRSGSMISRTIKGDFTPLDVCARCVDVYNVYIRWDNKTKTCTIYTQVMGTPVGAFATRELNLKEINYKGKSNDLITRLYAYGKDGLSFASINGGKEYVDNNDYSDRIICGIWRDERYTVAADLLADAQRNLAKLAKPVRSYDCAIIDLKATNPELYNNMNFGLFTAATLIDDVKETAFDYQVVERHIYPYHPEKNEVIFNSEPQKITNSVVNLQDQIEHSDSIFNQIQAARIAEATDWLTSSDGYIWIKKDAAGWWKEIYMMDTNDPATAQNVFVLNNNGIGISNTGVNGPFISAWTIDGKFNCDWLLAGSITANLIKAGVLSDLAGKFSLDMTTGALTMQSGTFGGSLNAATGTFAGSLSAATGSFAGSLSAATGTFSGSLSAAGGTFTGSLSAATGSFSGDVTASTGSIGDFSISNGNLKVGDAILSRYMIGCGFAGSGIVAMSGNHSSGDEKYGFIQISNSGNMEQDTCIDGIRIYGNGYIEHYNGSGNVDWSKSLNAIP